VKEYKLDEAISIHGWTRKIIHMFSLQRWIQ